MKHSIFIALGGLLFAMSANYASAQMDNRINGSPSDFTMLKSRSAIVEVKEEDPKIIEALSKDKKNPDAVAHYKDFIANCNKMLKQAVDKNWKFNASIEYKTTTELKSIIGSDKEHVIISYQTMNGETFSGPIEKAHADYGTAYSMPEIWLNRSERKLGQEPDDYIYLPISVLGSESSPECWGYVQADYDFAITQMQANIEYMRKENKKIIYEDYAALMSKQNCGNAQNATLEMDKNQLDEKVDESAIKSFYKGPFEITDGTAKDDFEKQKDNIMVVFSCAYGIASGSVGMVSTSALYFAKAVINCKTGEIMYYHKPFGGMGFGSATTWQYPLRKYFFYYMGKCKQP